MSNLSKAQRVILASALAAFIVTILIPPWHIGTGRQVMWCTPWTLADKPLISHSPPALNILVAEWTAIAVIAGIAFVLARKPEQNPG